MDEKNFSSTDELVSSIGRPDFITIHPEGDEDWTYAVRVWPWNSIVYYSVYHSHVIGVSKGAKAGLFYEPIATTRTENESEVVRKLLKAYYK
jgi:hypothetical protein